MKIKSYLSATMSVIFALAQAAWGENIYFDDGQTHVINYDTHQNQSYGIWLDKNTFNDPGTHLELRDGAKTGYILPFNKSTITINGGTVNGFNISIDTEGDNVVTINGGTLIGDMAANNNSRIYIYGGTMNDDVCAYDTGIAEVRGGHIGGAYSTFDSGTIYLYGSNFQVNGQNVSYGDSLRNYVSIPLTHDDYYTGTVTGTLLDGSAVNNNFCIWASTNSAIIVIPEPATLLLLGLGSFMLRKLKA